jgi:hypothetical protein
MTSKPSTKLFTCHYCHKQFPDEMTLPVQVDGRILSMCVFCDDEIRDTREEMISDDDMPDMS